MPLEKEEIGAHLIHLLELRRDRVEARHELVMPRLPQVVVPFLAGVSLGSDGVEVGLTFVELGLTLAVLSEDGHVGFGLGETLYGWNDGRVRMGVGTGTVKRRGKEKVEEGRKDGPSTFATSPMSTSFLSSRRTSSLKISRSSGEPFFFLSGEVAAAASDRAVGFPSASN
jgi:hypothetical protein